SKLLFFTLGWQQWVDVNVQQCDEILYLLCISSVEFTKHTHTLLISMGHHNISETPEQWADRLFEFHNLYQRGILFNNAKNTLKVDSNL
ncbi:hypothetical protein C0993_006394, partial [Termitomyces sp. T159_Od127]